MKNWKGYKNKYIEVLGKANKVNNRIYWNIKCACGRCFLARTDQLPNKVKSCGCLSKLDRGKAAYNKVYGAYKRSAIKRGYSFDLTIEDFITITSKQCYYCGSYPDQLRSTSRMNGSCVYNGLDRYDNSKGYQIDNVVPCCGFCNRAKFNKTITEFESWINRLVVYRSRKE